MTPAAVPAAAGVIDDDLVQIDDEEVPLAVIGDDETDADGELREIEEEETPLANVAVPEEAGRIWWSWIPVIGAVASAVESYRQNKKDKEKSDDNKQEN